MKILLLGSGGQVGRRLAGALGCFADVVEMDHARLDLADLAALRSVLHGEKAQLVVNAAAYTDVDGAERDEAAATHINGEAVAVLGEECRRLRAGLVHYSTDFVFDGKEARSYREDDATAPLGAYGRSKLAGERALVELAAPAIVLRTAWVYSPRRRSFVTTILRLAREREVLKVVSDQVGNPTFAGDLASATAALVRGLGDDPFEAVDATRGIYHLAGAGTASRFDLARAAIELDPRKQEHRVRAVEPVDTAAFPLPAPRPQHAPLDCEKARARFGIALPDWRAALARALDE